jgi:hypothetical protein
MTMTASLALHLSVAVKPWQSPLLRAHSHSQAAPMTSGFVKILKAHDSMNVSEALIWTSLLSTGLYEC